MLSLFSTNSNVAGYRLHYMEVYNWGTFHNQIYKINPQGNNSLLTGANASGKSTLVDALLTLLVPTKKDRFYNQSSGVEKKGDRTEETYVLGNYGHIQNEGEIGTSTQKLRDKNTYSIILASFTNIEQRDITLFQVRWFANGVLKRSFGISRKLLEIQNDFINFDSKGTWKKILEQKYNANSTKKQIEFFDDRPIEYRDRVWSSFGMRSEKGLTLFNQIVGVKVLDNLDEFIRTNMLEEKEAENEYIQLKENFLTLMEAKINIDKTKEQIDQLQPIDEIANKLNEIQENIDKLQQSNKIAENWFAKKKIELAEKELKKCNDDLDNLNYELNKLNEKERELTDKESDLRVQIKTDAVGSQIEKLNTEIERIEKDKKERSDNLNTYNKIAQKIKFSEDPNEETFISNREKAKIEKNRLENLIKDELNENLRLAKNKEYKIQEEIKENCDAIQSLRKYKNNISGREARIRELILEAVGATEEEIPFIGELICVKDSEKDWEPSIEKILHNFALRLIVPEKYYQQVNQFVNTNNLKGRIVYQRYKGFTSLKEFENKNIAQNSLLNKIEYKQGTYANWLEDVLYNSYNYACVNNLSEFNRYEERAITKEGLIKAIRGKHEKDDRPDILRKEYYVLGWDNKEKIRIMETKFKNLQDEQKTVMEEIRTIKKSIEDTSALKEEFFKLFEKYVKYDDIDWQSYARIIQEKTEEKANLENTSNKIKEWEKQLEKVRKDLKQLRETDIKSKTKSIHQTEERQKLIEIICTENTDSLSQSDEIYTANFEQSIPDLSNITFENIKEKETEFLDKNKQELEKQKKCKIENESRVASLIRAFKNPQQEITNKFRDWSSDVNKLPDSEHLEFIAEYQSFYKKLISDDLIRFEKKFNDYLRETVTNKVSAFRMFFRNWEDSITDTIKHLNESLKGIDFNNNPPTYIQLVAPKKLSDEVTEFRTMLDKAIPNIREVDSTIEGRKNHFENYIEPLIKKLENEQWRKKVMEVRAWFTYKAEEFYKETNQKHKTYENMGQLSGGEKAQLTYTILGSAIAYQFGTKEGLQSKSFRFIAIDEAFKSQDEDKARYLISLCKQLHLQFLVVTPSDNIHIVKNDISFVHYVERNKSESILYNMTIKQFEEEREKFVNI